MSTNQEEEEKVLARQLIAKHDKVLRALGETEQSSHLEAKDPNELNFAWKGMHVDAQSIHEVLAPILVPLVADQDVGGLRAFAAAFRAAFPRVADQNLKETIRDYSWQVREWLRGVLFPSEANQARQTQNEQQRD